MAKQNLGSMCNYITMYYNVMQRSTANTMLKTYLGLKYKKINFIYLLKFFFKFIVLYFVFFRLNMNFFKLVKHTLFLAIYSVLQIKSRNF